MGVHKIAVQGLSGKSVLLKLDTSCINADSTEIPVSHLSDDETSYMCDMNNSLGDDFVKAHFHANHKIGGKFEPPDGVVMQFTPHAIAHPKLLKSGTGAQIMGCKIKDRSDISDGYFEQRLGNLNKIPRDHESAISLSALLSKDPKDPIDAAPWVTTRGKRGWIQVRKIAGDRGKNIYYLYVYSDSGRAGEDLKLFALNKFRKTKDKKPFTLKDLERSREYHKTIELARRNAERLLLEAAHVLGVEITGKVYDDPYARTVNVHHATPQIVIPEIHNEMNTIKVHRNPKGDPEGVSYFSSTTPTEDARGGLVYISDPTLDMRVYHVPKKIGRPAREGFSNDANSSFAPFTPVKVGDEIEQVDPNSVDPHVQQFIHRTITWDGKGTDEFFHPKLFGRYAEFHPKTDLINENMLNARYGYTNFKSVASCIPQPSTTT